jgi:chloramphenicol O-acetyltransferase type A
MTIFFVKLGWYREENLRPYGHRRRGFYFFAGGVVLQYKIIDMSKDPRHAQYEYFRQMANPFAGLTVQVDVTDFVEAVKGRPFFLSFLYALTRAANCVPELRRRIRGDDVVEFDACESSCTIMKDNGVYAYCLLDTHLPYEAFLTEGKRREEAALAHGTLDEEGNPLSNYFVSCLPWLTYTQIQHPATDAGDSNPRFSWGKYYTQGDRVLMPVSVFANHALADGLHFSRFYENLEREMQQLCNQINEDKRGK